LLPASLASILLLTAAAPAEAPAVDVPGLIDKLADVADSDVGYSPVVSGSPFLPLDWQGRWEVGVLFQKPPAPSDTLRTLVKQGAAAVPQLIAHLDDKRPTKITVKHDFALGGVFRDSRCDYNARTAKADPNPKRSEDKDDDNFGAGASTDGHVLSVGDLCFVALGQIVNRRFDAVHYVPTAIIIVTSPTESPALRATVKKEWGGLTPERHKMSLIDDFLKPDSDERRVGACKRLAYYYPYALEPLALKFLARPTYKRWDVEQFVHTDLYGADGSKELHDRFERYIAGHGEASRDGILLQLFEDLQWLEAKERGAHNASADQYGDKPRRFLVELYGKGKDVKSADVPRVDAPSTGVMAKLIEEGLIYDDSRKIDAAVRGLLAATDDDYLALSCLKRLVGRGYDADIENYCKRQLPSADKYYKRDLEEILNKAGWTRLHTAVERGDVDEVRRRIGERADVNAAAKDGRTPLHVAAAAGNREIVQALLDGKADINAKDAVGRTPVQLAAHEDQEEVVLLLAERGCDFPDILSAANAGKTEVVEALLQKDAAQAAAKNAHGRTPLHLAARRGHSRTAAALLKAGAAVNARDEEGWTPLHFAAAGGYAEAVRVLLENNADANAFNNRADKCTPLHLAVLSGNLKTAELLIDHRADPNIGADSENGSPLHVAVDKGSAAMVALLLDKGGRVDLKNKDGRTPLHLAAQAGREDVARVLLDHKADVRGKGPEGREPLHEAAAAGRRPTVALLIDHKADIGARDDNGATPLHLAARENHAEIVSLLLDRGAAVDAKEDSGATPLIEAGGCLDGEVVRILLEHKANASAATKNGWKPLHEAAVYDNRKAVDLLLDHGAAVNAKNGDGQTPLQLAATCGYLKTVQALLARGAAANVRDNNGSTPLHGAARNGFVEVVKALLDHKADPTVKNNKGQTPLEGLVENYKHTADIKRLLEQITPME